MKLKYKVWLDHEGKAFGAGPAEILKCVDSSGSLSAAARDLGISYTKAWRIINMAEERLGFKLLLRETGGKNGGNSLLTEEGRTFLQQYSSFMREADEQLQVLFDKYFAGYNQ